MTTEDEKLALKILGDTSYRSKEPEGRKPEGTGYRVLIVDDSIFIVKQLTKILASAGFALAGTANNGNEAMLRYKELYPNIDLVTMDITMPLMDGISALGEILKFDSNANVIMISALGKEDAVRKAMLMGAKGFIVKPLDREKVLSRLVAFIEAELK
ncbi:response regulator [Spirochaetia bacterium]|nr:response regulator [Spirochaetia bacterium]